MEKSETDDPKDDIKVIESLLGKICLTPSTHTPSMEDMDISYLSSIAPEAQQVTARRRLSFSEFSFENEPDLVSGAINPSSLSDILHLDDHTYHGGHSSTRVTSQDIRTKKRKQSFTKYSFENLPDLLSAHHGAHSSRKELTMDPLSKKRKLSHTIVSSENQPQVALDLEESPGNIYSDDTLGATCATTSFESDNLSPMLETASSNPISLGDILPLDDHTHHGAHSSRKELTMDPLSKKRKLSHTIVSSENQPQVALDLEESPGNIYSDDTLGATCATTSFESDNLSPMLETASSNPISLGDILPLDDHTHHGAHSSRKELTMDPLSKKRKLSHTIVSSENQPQVALDLEESPGNIYFDDTLSLNSMDSLFSESDSLSPMLETKIFLTESEDENMICLEVFQPLATENTSCQFQMMKNQPLLQLMISYCIYAEIELSEAEFVFEGKVITETDTPESLQMENEDLIVVYY